MPEVDHIIEESKLRCGDNLLSVDKKNLSSDISERVFDSIVKSNKRFVKSGKKIIIRLQPVVNEFNVVFFLTDNQGRVLSINGEERLLAFCDEIGLRKGSVLKETHSGTQAVALSIRDESVFYTSGDDHYLNILKKVSFSAAPVFSVRKRLLGVAGAMWLTKKGNTALKGVVASAAMAIEDTLATSIMDQQLQDSLLYAFTIMNSLSFGMVAVNTGGEIEWINDTACNIFNVKRTLLLNQSIKNFFKDFENIRKITISKRIVLDEEVVFTIGNKRLKYSLNSYPIESQEGNMLGVILSFREMQRVINLINKYTGMQAYFTFDDIICESESMKSLKRYAKRIAASPTTILIQGDSGTGKEVFAQSIHNAGERREMGFVAINCGAISPN
ncbi:MAG: sigma 54-interacting transcriptional regulator, partial [Bacteroidota bacterium]|nr:sigma 54-interacting transcriptional regulator [Bacteroidota bacterium]